MVLLTSLCNSIITLGSAAAIKPFSKKARLKPFLFSFLLYFVLELFVLKNGYPGFLVKILILFLFHRLILLRSFQSGLIQTFAGLTILVASNIMTALSLLMLKGVFLFDKIVTGFDELSHIGWKFLYVLFFVFLFRLFLYKLCKSCMSLSSYPVRLLLFDALLVLPFIFIINITLRYVISHITVFSTIPNLDLIFYLLIMVMILSSYLALFLVNSHWISKQDFSVIKCQAELDPMTGLYNRRYGMQLLHATYCRARAQNTNFVLCFFDINNLKVVNDRYGHPEGDELILTMAKTAKQELRERDYIIRYGGDEFIIVFVDCSLNEAKGAWARISSSYDNINMMKDRKYYISASAGFSSYEENKGLNISELINLADNEMYKAKRSFKQYTRT